MHTYFLVLLILVSSTGLAKRTNDDSEVVCDGMVFIDSYYDKRLLFKGLGRSYSLVMHNRTGQLYFSHALGNNYRTQQERQIMSCNINNKSCRIIPGIVGGYTVFHDRVNNEIYFGGYDGIYRYNNKTKSAEYFAEKGKAVWSFFIRKNFYYVQHPAQKLFLHKRGEFVKVGDVQNIEIDYFFISKRLEVYYANKTALYKSDNPDSPATILDEEIVVRQIAEDMHGHVYFCASDGIYIDDKPHHRIKKVADIDQAFGMAFIKIKKGKPQLIFSDKDGIHRLIPNNKTQCLNTTEYSDLTKKKRTDLLNLEIKLKINK